MAEAVQIHIDGVSLARTMAELKEFEPKLALALKRRLRDSAKIVMQDVHDAIMAYPANKDQTGMRQELAASLAIRVKANPNVRKHGVQIVSTGSQLPGAKKILARAMNAKKVRHPVFGRDAWVDQPGMRFFGKEVIEKHKGQVVLEMQKALEEAALTLRG